MSRIRILTVGGFSMAFASLVMAADPVLTAGADLAAVHRASRAGEVNVLQALHKKIKVQWADAPFPDVLQSIAEAAEVNLSVDKQSLADEGVSLDTEVTLNLGETSIWTALTFLMEPLGLDWSERNGVLEITTHAKADEQLTTRIYDVSAIVKAIEPELQSVEYRRRWWQRQAVGAMFFSAGIGEHDDDDIHPSQQPLLAQFGGMGLGGPIEGHPQFQIGARIGDPTPQAETVLAILLQSSCSAKWMNIDQEGGAIVSLRGRLIVRQTYEVHHQVRGLLRALEDFLVLGVKAKSRAVRRPAYPLDEDAAILDRLAKVTTMRAITDAHLDEVIQVIAKEHRFRFWIDRPALNDEGINTDQLVSVSAQSGVPLGVILNQILEPFGMTTIVHEGVLVVTTQAKAEEKESIVVYDLSEITGGGPEELHSAIEQTTPGKWIDIDQEGGSIDFFGPRLVVIRQTQRIHSEVTNLFDELRKGSDPKAEPARLALQQRIYPVADATAIADLLRSLPTLVPKWDKNGSAVQLGECLMINQPLIVHDRVGEIILALNNAHTRLHPKPATPAPAPSPKTP